MNNPVTAWIATGTDSGKPRRLACHVWDSGAPENLLCVHGLTRNGRDFDALAQAMGAQYRVFCPDMPGRGQSPWLEDKSGYNYAAYLQDITALLDAVGTARVDWVGTSMGGILGMMMAANAPSRVRKLVLNDVGAFIPRAGLLRLGGYVGKRVAFATREEGEAVLREVFSPFGIADEWQWESLFRHSLEPAPEGGFRAAYDPALGAPFTDESQIQDVDLSAVWEKISCPVLILRGAQSDILTHETAAKMQASRPAQVTYLEIPNVGHAPSLMRAEEITLVKRWLAAEPG